MLPLAIVTITLALVLYTIAVFWERRDGGLRGRHLLFFVLGLACDTAGTGLMMTLAGGWRWDFHAITGGLAIVLMLLHAAWAIWVHASRDRTAAARFTKFSVTVWAVWLVPYLSGFVLNMLRR